MAALTASTEKTSSASSLQKADLESGSESRYEDVDLNTYYEEKVGSLVVDPQEAKHIFGDRVSAQLKLSPDGQMVLWPQPSDESADPQNWSDRKKLIHLFIVTLAAIVPDFDSGISITSIFVLAKQFDTTTEVINDLTNNWPIFLLGWGGIFAVMFMRRIGRLPVLFWTQLLALGFFVGCTFAPNLKVFTAFRALSAFFATTPQVTGLFIVVDMYPFHLQARFLNIWTMGFILSPFISPFVFGFLVARASWRWAYGIGCMYGLVVLFLIVFVMDETLFDRRSNIRADSDESKIEPSGVKQRIRVLSGIAGVRSMAIRPACPSWTEVILAPLNLVWRPHLLLMLIFEAMVFGFSIGINLTNPVFLGSPPPFGYGLGQFSISGIYATPVVAVVIGELIGRYINQFIQDRGIRRNKGVFEAEIRLWACYVAMPLYLCGFLALGAADEKKLNISAFILGWGIAQVSIMINTVAIYAYCNDCFPKHQGEISGLINLARTLGGFAVSYFQVPWAQKHGAIQVFGVEAAIVLGLFFLCVPYVQLKGKSLRARFSC